MKLPKYKKKWKKEFSIDPTDENEIAIYLRSVQNSKMNSIYITNNTLKIYQGYFSLEKNKIFFFELFKYLAKYYSFKFESTNMRGIYQNGYEQDIKTHLIIKFSNNILKNLEVSVNEKFILLKLYSDLITSSLNLVKDGHKFELVIQKKIGYKYYQNIIYY